MDKTTIQNPQLAYSRRFRVPSPGERRLGLWVDRVGSGSGGTDTGTWRVLGLYAAVAVLAGQGRYHVPGSEPQPVQAGEALLLTPQQPSAYWADPAWETCWVVWHGGEAESWEALGLLPRPGLLPAPAASAVADAHARLTLLIPREDRLAILERKQALGALVLALARLARAGTASRADHALGERLVAYLQAHARDDLSIAAAARAQGLSPTHFRRLFHAHTGRSPRAFVTELRIARARELLAAGASIKAAAQDTGFRDAAYFMRTFSRITGLPPGRFARQSQGL